MIVYFNAKNFLNRLFDGLYPWVAKLYYLTAIRHDDVVVLLVKIRLFIVALVLSELVAAYQAAFQQQLYGIVKRGTAHAVVLVFHFDVERLYVKMFLAIVNFLKYSIALRCFPVASVFQVFGEDIFYNLLVFIIFHGMGINTCKDNAKYREVKV